MNQETAIDRKKVLYLITKATWGGAQRYVYDLTTNLQPSVFEPHVAYGTEGKLSHDLGAAGIALHHLPSLGRDVAIISDVKSFFEIYHCLRSLRPDIVHLNSSKAAALGAVAARLAGVRKIIFTVHGWPFGEKRNFFARLVIWKISWLTGLLSHSVICVSEHDAEQARRMPFLRSKVVRIYNGIAPMSFGSGEIVRAAFPAGARITGTVGELTTNKNHKQLIEEALQDPSKYVAIVGEGELRATLGKMIREHELEQRVKLFGFVPAAEVLKGFDVFALPSIKEGLPYVLLEARQVGIPIVANRVGGVGEVLDAKDMSEFSLETMVRKTVALY